MQLLVVPLYRAAESRRLNFSYSIHEHLVTPDPSLGPKPFFAGEEKRPDTICLKSNQHRKAVPHARPPRGGEMLGATASRTALPRRRKPAPPDSTRILNRILSDTRLHIPVFYPCTLVYTCNSNLVPNTSAV